MMNELFARDMAVKASKSSTALTAAWDVSASEDSNPLPTEDLSLIDTQADLANLLGKLDLICHWDRRG
jgi:hypothetical protein